MLGAELRQVREDQGLTVRQLANRSGLSVEAVSAIERGARYPSFRSLECLASALRVCIVIGPEETILERD
jgi:transcriptional regulator with XRE-family HTH domain